MNLMSKIWSSSPQNAERYSKDPSTYPAIHKGKRLISRRKYRLRRHLPKQTKLRRTRKYSRATFCSDRYSSELNMLRLLFEHDKGCRIDQGSERELKMIATTNRKLSIDSQPLQQHDPPRYSSEGIKSSSTLSFLLETPKGLSGSYPDIDLQRLLIGERVSHSEEFVNNVLRIHKYIKEIRTQRSKIDALLIEKQTPIIQTESKLSRVLSEFIELKDKDDLAYFPRLNTDMMEKVEAVWANTNEDSIVVKHEHILEKLTVKALKTLRGEEWLNDEVINGYIRLVNHYLTSRGIQKYVANSYFHGLMNKELNPQKIERIFKRHSVDLTKLEQLFVPLNQSNSHWSFMMIDFPGYRIIYFDSLTSSELPEQGIHVQLAKFINEKRRDPSLEYKIEKSLSFPTQMNGHDCGVFVLKGIDYLARFGRIIFDQKDTQYLRYLICYELLLGRFLPYEKQTPAKS